jgi:hypothetical protein
MAKFRPGQSGNPAGKQKGLPDRRRLLRMKIEHHADELIELALSQARAGDTTALAMLLSRAVAPVRAEASPVAFQRPTGTSASDWARSVLAAVADGQLAPDTGKHLIDAIASVANITAIDEIEARLAKLESGEPDDET